MQTPEVITPYNDRGNPMSPYEARTGVVLSLWAPSDGLTNRHHPHFFKEKYEKGPRKTRGFLCAVRFSRLQRIELGYHERHHREFEGTELPEDSDAGFRITVLNMSGYIAPFVLDMTQGPGVVRETTPAMFEALRKPGIMTIENSSRRIRGIGNFLMEYAIRRGFTPNDQSMVDEFIHLPVPNEGEDYELQEKRRNLGLQLVDLAIVQAVDPIEPYFREARQAHALREGAAPTAFEEVKSFVAGYEPDYFETLQQSLTRQFAQAA